MKIIFLDIDGVLCTFRSHVAAGGGAPMEKLDPIAIGLIDRLLETGPDQACVVITSVWRKTHTREDIIGRFRAEGFRGAFHDDWRTPESPAAFRGDEVRSWLDRHPEIEGYICIDDDSDFYPEQPHVKTDCYEGLSFGNFLQASALLSGDTAAVSCNENRPRHPAATKIPAAPDKPGL